MTTTSTEATAAAADSAKNPLADLLDAEEARFVSCLPPRLPQRGFDVYVTRRTNFPAQLQRCRRLLRRPPHLCWVHGLGASVTRAANLALQLADELIEPPAVYTSTVACTDRMLDQLSLPDDDEAELGGGDRKRQRLKSALHIRLEAAPTGSAANAAAKTAAVVAAASKAGGPPR